MQLNKDKVIERIVERLNVITELRDGRPLWTALVKDVFIDLADEFKCKVATAGAAARSEGERKPDWGEWLYDLVWYTSELDEKTNVERTTSVQLVMECEWDASLDAIALDFDKLLVANADLRLMVCGGYKNFPAKPIYEQCKRAVQSYQQGRIGDTFLVCIVPEVGAPECMEIVRR